MSGGLQEFRRRPVRLGPILAWAGVLGRILVAGALAYAVSFLLGALTPLGGWCYFAIGPVAAGLGALMLGGRVRP